LGIHLTAPHFLADYNNLFSFRRLPVPAIPVDNIREPVDLLNQQSAHIPQARARQPPVIFNQRSNLDKIR
jgi:hypothetical protein